MGSRITTIGAVIVLLLIFSLPIVFKDQPDPVPTDAQKPKTETTYNLSDVTLTGHDRGERQWMLRVNSVFEREKGAAIFDGLQQGEVYQKGEAKYFLTANKGEYDRQREEFKLNDRVLITTTDGRTIRTDNVEYSLLLKRLTSGEVEVEGSDMLLHAYSMAIDVNNEIFDFSGGVEVEFTIEDEETGSEGGETEAREEGVKGQDAAKSADVKESGGDKNVQQKVDNSPLPNNPAPPQRKLSSEGSRSSDKR